MKTLALVVLFCVVVSCGKKEDSSNGKYDGTYLLGGVECYDSNNGENTAAAILDNGFKATVKISGSRIVTTTEGSGCIATTTGNVSLNPEEGSGGHYGELSLSNQLSVTNTGTQCTQSYTLQAYSGDTITPSGMSSTTDHNYPSSDVTGIYMLSDEGHLALYSTYKSSNPTDICFMIYLKQ